MYRKEDHGGTCLACSYGDGADHAIDCLARGVPVSLQDYSPYYGTGYDPSYD